MIAHTTETIFQLVDDFLAGTLTEPEMDQFEDNLKQDIAFKTLVKKYLSLRLALKMCGRERLKREIAEDIEQYLKYQANVPSLN